MVKKFLMKLIYSKAPNKWQQPTVKSVTPFVPKVEPLLPAAVPGVQAVEKPLQLWFDWIFR